MAVKAGDGYAFQVIDIGQDFVRAFIIACPYEVEVRLYIFYLDQKMFPQNLHLVEFNQIPQL